jgi:hypothetical protein
VAKKRRPPRRKKQAVQCQANGNVLTVTCDNVSAGWEQWFLLRSDVHWDHPHCRRDLERKHLEEAVEKNALVFDFGDLFCVMQGRHDRRRGSEEDKRPEHRGRAYLNKLASDAVEYYSAYPGRIALLGYGNHETRIVQETETDLTALLAEGLGATTGSTPALGGYQGWVRVECRDRSGNGETKVIRYHHGFGGGVVTRGVNRALYWQASDMADVYVSGHTHTSWELPDTRVRLGKCGTEIRDPVLHLKCSGYKDSTTGKSFGWEIEKHHKHNPLTNWWLRLTYRNKRVTMEPMMAR